MALDLIASGETYAQIKNQYGIPKSTLSVWFKNSGKKPDRTRQLAHLRIARIAATTIIQQRKKSRIEIAERNAKHLSIRLPFQKEAVGKALLAMLYWAEGGKQDNNMKFTNTDPGLVSLFVSLLREHYQIDEGRFRIALLVHYYHDQNETRDFWSKKLKIPVSQFWKIYLKPRGAKKKEYRRNFYGICNLHYSSSAIQRELIALGKEIASRVAGEEK